MAKLGKSVQALLGEGRAPGEIARDLGLARTTVDYHARRLSEHSEHHPFVPETVPPQAWSLVTTREAVRDLLEQGRSRTEIATTLGVSKSTVSYHARRLGATVDERCARRYDWRAIQAYYDEGHTVRQCSVVFGFSLQTWHAARLRGQIATRGAAMPIGELLVADLHRSRQNIKRRLLGEGLKRAECERCGAARWLGAPIPLDLHHVNGVRDDNRIENLTLLCPNCHALVEAKAAGRRSLR